MEFIPPPFESNYCHYYHRYFKSIKFLRQESPTTVFRIIPNQYKIVIIKVCDFHEKNGPNHCHILSTDDSWWRKWTSSCFIKTFFFLVWAMYFCVGVTLFWIQGLDYFQRKISMKWGSRKVGLGAAYFSFYKLYH